MKHEKIHFPGHSHGSLATRLIMSRAEPCAHALFAHGSTCLQGLMAARRIAFRLVGKCIAVVGLDCTALGYSVGVFAKNFLLLRAPRFGSLSKNSSGGGLADVVGEQ